MPSGTKRERVIQRVIWTLCNAGEAELAWAVVHTASRRYPILEKKILQTIKDAVETVSLRQGEEKRS